MVATIVVPGLLGYASCMVGGLGAIVTDAQYKQGRTRMVIQADQAAMNKIALLDARGVLAIIVTSRGAVRSSRGTVRRAA